MSPLIELITAWEKYSATTNSTISVKGFIESYIQHSAADKADEILKNDPKELAQVTGRLSSIHKTYLKLAIKDLPGTEIEWYFLLNTIHQVGTVRKTEVPSINLLLEPTTCIDILNRMIKADLLDEKIDQKDKRARLLSMTKKGMKMLKQMQQLVDDINLKLYGHIAKPDQEHIIRTLEPIEREHTKVLFNMLKKKSN